MTVRSWEFKSPPGHKPKIIMNSTITKAEDGTIKLNITVPVAEFEKTKNAVVEKLASQTQVAGFRKGKAPKKLVEEKLDKAVVEEETLRNVIPTHYSLAIREHKLTPIINPRIHIEKLEEGKDLEFIAEICETPAVDLGKYKEEVKKITAKSKIVVPGKEKPEVSFDEIISALVKSANIKVPSIIIEMETQRLLSQTLEEIKKLGLALDQYLASTGKTAEELQADYASKAENDIKIELALQKVAEEEKISVEPKEVEEAISKAKDENEKRSLQANSYLLASILRQQKTLDYLRNL